MTYHYNYTMIYNYYHLIWPYHEVIIIYCCVIMIHTDFWISGNWCRKDRNRLRDEGCKAEGQMKGGDTMEINCNMIIIMKISQRIIWTFLCGLYLVESSYIRVSSVFKWNNDLNISSFLFKVLKNNWSADLHHTWSVYEIVHIYITYLTININSL